MTRAIKETKRKIHVRGSRLKYANEIKVQCGTVRNAMDVMYECNKMCNVQQAKTIMASTIDFQM